MWSFDLIFVPRSGFTWQCVLEEGSPGNAVPADRHIGPLDLSGVADSIVFHTSRHKVPHVAKHCVTGDGASKPDLLRKPAVRSGRRT